MIGLGIAILSFIDDIVELSAKFRMVSHFLFATFGLWLLGGLSIIKTGKLQVGKQTVAINNFTKTFYDNKGKLQKQVQTINRGANLNVIFMSNYKQFLVVDNSVYNSLYFQLFVLEKYNKELFESTILTPLAKVYRLKI